MADAGDLKSPVLNGRAGSSPASATDRVLREIRKTLFLSSHSAKYESRGVFSINAL